MTPTAAVSVLVDSGIPEGLAREALAPFGADCDISAADLDAAEWWARTAMGEQ